MSRLRSALVVVLTMTTALIASCSPGYLREEPPAEFSDYVAGVPIPKRGIPLAENMTRVVAPRKACTTFSYSRLFGSEDNYKDIEEEYEQQLAIDGRTYVRMAQHDGLVTYVVGQNATVGIAATSADDPVALLSFNKEVLDQAQGAFQTLFIFAVEHSYGSCSPHPFWKPTQR